MKDITIFKLLITTNIFIFGNREKYILIKWEMKILGTGISEHELQMCT